MSWRKHFETYQGLQSPISGSPIRDRDNTRRFQSWLPEIYVGQPNRLERYIQYDQMDLDSEINTALDTISEFSTQQDESTETPFQIKWNDTPTETESEVILTVLKQWVRVNDWNRRLFNTFRNTIKYGDQPFVRDPETWKLFYVAPNNVLRVIVDEAAGKEPAQYVIKNLDPNFQTLTATAPQVMSGATTVMSPTTLNATANSRTPSQLNGSAGMGADTEFLVDAKHVIHLALTDGMDLAWPFGNSILDAIFKTYKQKELLEDSIIIYRVQRAPERRIFYIDVGDMPAHQAMAHVERVKNEIHQRRIPTRTGGGANIMDAQYNPLCLSYDTTIPLLDGRTLTLSELIKEYESGKENWTYSCDPITGKIVPGNITWAGATRKNAQVIKLYFDDGNTLTVTPDHKIPVLGKGFVKAKDLIPEDSLISYKTRKLPLLSNKEGVTYTQIYDHESNNWIFSHRMTAMFFRSLSKHQEFTFLEENINTHKSVVHHKDFNRYNNDPRNLQWMSHSDHLSYHRETNFWNAASPKAIAATKKKISDTNKRNYQLLTSAEKDKKLENIKYAQKIAIWNRLNDPISKVNYNKNMGISRRKFLNKNPEFVTNILLPNLSKISDNYPNQEKVYTFDQLQKLYNLAEAYDFKLKSIISDKSDLHDSFLQEIKKSNSPKNGHNFKIQTNIVTQQVLYNTIRHFGYKNWMDFKRKQNEFNHRITKIEWLNEKQDVGTITIDGNEKWHNYHTFPVNDSIFVKNSIMEDYFFAQTAEGRGSKVDTLPGGQNLGEIDDLKFFNNKLARGLRIPSSYLPTGPDDGTSSYNDGKVGTAFIQEYRFTQYCQRIQRILQPTFDKEFKMFLKHRGYEIDSSQFELNFVEPQSFSDYREIEINGARASVFGQLEGVDYMSKRFALKKYLQLTEDEILENEKLWKQENPIKGSDAGLNDGDDFSDLGNVGVQGGLDGSLDDFEEDDDEFNNEEDNSLEPGIESPIAGDEGSEEI